MLILPGLFIAIFCGLLVLILKRRRREPHEFIVSGKLSKALIENSLRGIHFYHTDDKDRLIFIGANKAADEILGVDHSQFIGKPIEEAFPSLASTEVPQRYRETAKKGTPWMTEQISYHGGKIQGCYELVCFQLERNFMATVFSDVTDRKKAEEELENQRLFLKTIFDSMPGIFYIYSWPELKLVYWNRNHEVALGYTADELRSRSFFDWFPLDMQEPILRTMRRMIETGEPALRETPLSKKDGTVVPYLTSTVAFEGIDGVNFAGFGLDISDQKKMQEELRVLNQELEKKVGERTQELTESRDRLERTLGILKDSQNRLILQEKIAALGTLVSGLAHELNTPLGAIQSACGVGDSAISGLRSILDLYRSLSPEELALFNRLRACIEHPDFLESPLSGRERSREYRKILSEKGFSEPVSMLEDLQDIAFDGDPGELASLCTMPRFPEILTAIHHIASLARSQYVTSLAVDRATQVVRALRTYYRVEPSEGFSEVDVRSQIDTVLTILRNQLKGGVDVVKRFSEVPAVRCYPDRLNHVWMNLITNAIQAMEYQGRLELVIEPDPAGVKVVVGDSGPGIPSDIQARIFEPFFTTKREGEGTGLGLDICKRILSEIGATISFESEPGCTRFFVFLKHNRE